MKKVISGKLIFVSILHFLVDFLCAGGVMAIDFRLGSTFTYIPYNFLVYNCTAFLLQPFFGILVDKFKGDTLRKMLKALLLFSTAGILLAITLDFINNFAFGYNGLAWATFIISTLLGTSNALFHVVGGKESLTMTIKATPGGLFVSTGALGVGLASALVLLIEPISSGFLVIYYLIAPVLLVLFTVLYVINKRKSEELVYESYRTDKIGVIISIIALLCFAVGVRSFLGFYSTMSPEMTGWRAILILAAAAFFGKAIGGIIMDLGGPYVLVGVSTLLSAISAIFLSTSYVDVIFVLSFNLLMPLTLDALRKFYIHKEGFAFGLAAAFLIPGFFVAQLLKEYGVQPIVVPIICLLTGGALILVYILRNKTLNNGSDN